MLDQFSQVPKNMKILMAALCAIAVLAVTAMIGRQAVLIAAVGIVVVVVELPQIGGNLLLFGGGGVGARRRRRYSQVA